MAGIIRFFDKKENFDETKAKETLQFFFEEYSADVLGWIYKQRLRKAMIALKDEEKKDNKNIEETSKITEETSKITEETMKTTEESIKITEETMKTTEESIKIPEKTDMLLSDLEIVSCFIDIDDLSTFDPCTGLHTSEKLVQNQIPFPLSGLFKLSTLILQSELFQSLTKKFQTFCNILECDLSIEDVTKAFPIPNNYSSLLSVEKLTEIFIESLALKKRTGRYTLDDQKQ